MQNLLDGIWKKGLVWKCKEIFCYWAKVSSEEWWSICFSFVTARAVHFPFEQNIFAGTEAAAVQNYKFPLTFLIFHVFPAQNNMQKFLVKNLFSFLWIVLENRKSANNVCITKHHIQKLICWEEKMNWRLRIG